MLPNAKIMHVVKLQSVLKKSSIYNKLVADDLHS